MSNAKTKSASLSVKVMINKEKTKVLFLETDRDFTDVLISFLTLPLGKIQKLLEGHYGDEAPRVGSLSTLYKSLANLDESQFATKAAKQMLLNPRSSFADECWHLKLDISDSQRARYFTCCYSCSYKFVDVALYEARYCSCGSIINREGYIHPKCCGAFLAENNVSFLISDDLRVIPYTTEFIKTLENLSVGDLNGAELMNISLGIEEVIGLLKLSLISNSPLSEIILNKRQKPSFPPKHCETSVLLNPNEIKEDGSRSNSVTLKVTLQKSTNKLLFAQSEADFIELLFNFLLIPLGGVEYLLDNNTCFKNFDNLYRSLANPIDDICIMSPSTKDRLMQPKITCGYASKDVILLLSEEAFPFEISKFQSDKGPGNYVLGKNTFMVSDDLTVTTFSVTSGISFLSRLNIPLCDIYGLEVKVGPEEALRILKASLTSTSALTDGLMIDHKFKKQPKQEK